MLGVQMTIGINEDEGITFITRIMIGGKDNAKSFW